MAGILGGLGLAACGSSTSNVVLTSSKGLHSPLTEQSRGGRYGGALTVLDPEGFGSVDPGRADSPSAYELVYATQRPLYSYQPNTFRKLTPDLALSQPVISHDRMTVIVHIRHGVHFSPPLNREVTSADVAYAIERGANPNVANPYFTTYFSSLVGAKQAHGRPIAGITTPNRYTIVFRLTEPRGQALADALVLPLSAPVPAQFARRYDAMSPSRYGEYEVATGPYMLKSDREGRTLGIGYRPGRSATLVRNHNWRASTDFRPAYVDEIHVEAGGSQQQVGRRVLAGSDLLEGQEAALATARLADRRYPSQLQISPGAGLRYLTLDHRQGPFSNRDVRDAFWAVLDRTAMDDAAGGPLLSQLAHQFIFPDIPGYALGEQAVESRGREVAYDYHPGGDLTLARSYMRLAGYPSGRYTGSHVMKTVGEREEPGAADARIAAEGLRKLGFRTTLVLLDRAAMVARCANPAEAIDVCPDGVLRADFGDAQAELNLPFNGADIRRGGENWGQVDDPELNSALERESKAVGVTLREGAWSDVDNALVGRAAAIPYGMLSGAEVESRDVAGVGDLWNRGVWDLSFTSLR